MNFFAKKTPASGANFSAEWSTNASAAYREATSAARMAADAAQLNALREAPLVEVLAGATVTALEIRLFSRGSGVPLFSLVPLLTAADVAVVSEAAYAWTTPTGPVTLQVLQATTSVAMTEAHRPLLAALVMEGLAGGGIDQLNELVLSAQLDLQHLRWLRALVAYAQQLDDAFAPGRSRTLLRNCPALAIKLTDLFAARLGPDAEAAQAEKLTQELTALVTARPTGAEEKLARALLTTVQATLRTNAWLPQVNDGSLPLAFKLDPALLVQAGVLHGLQPWREMFVFHPTVEGLHLRGGAVSRGGLRHSDRATDYRTEVLGLMLAMTRKNGIIVPGGAKGVFYVREPRPAELKPLVHSEKAYRMYIRALLSITDNYGADGQVVTPAGVRRLDGDDPYLVVAADKGTATFADAANDEALKAGFWLGDAFATGGSQGYDHKVMGITARGAWVSVAHHLRTLAIEPSAARPLTVVGIGDMAGDVFGNGLLCGRDLVGDTLQLLGAFNHKHIFLDPAPEPVASQTERQRCFDAGLGWDGYDASLISAGGGVWLRSEKMIPVSAAMQARLGLTQSELAPDELIKALLRAPVDLLWNGGVGTFIKAADELPAAAADHANDAIRVDAGTVQARIIGEGGNLGITPRGRVALARQGVRLNTDALDNSAGVDTSDHEVNLKILCQQAQASGQLSEPARLVLLRELTNAVAAQVLADNQRQNLAVTLEERASVDDHAGLARWQADLLARHCVDLQVDCLPTAQEVAARPEGKYVRPEIFGLLSGTKATLKLLLLTPEAADILASPAVAPLLQGYFPGKIHAEFAALIPQHRLAKEITATLLANELADRLGMLFGPRLREDFGAAPLDAVRAAVAAVALLDGRKVWHELNAAGLPLATEVAAHQRLRQVAYGLAALVLRHGQPVRLDRWLDDLQTGVRSADELLATSLSAAAKKENATYRESWQVQGLPAALAARFSLFSPLAIVPDAVILAAELKRPLAVVLPVQLGVGEALRLPAVIRHSRKISMASSWDRQAVQALTQELLMRQRKISANLLRFYQQQESSGAPELILHAWQQASQAQLARYQLLVDALLAEAQPSVAILAVVVGRLRELD